MKLEKVTNERQDAPKRRYDDACAATHGMDIIGERWALPIMRELMLGPRRFGELRSEPAGDQRQRADAAARAISRTRASCAG